MENGIKLENQDRTPRFFIGTVAKISGATPKAIRHYEAIGVLPKPSRRGRYRVYSELDIFVVHMIKMAQTVGFSLAEIKELVSRQVAEANFPLNYANRLFELKRSKLMEEVEEIQATIKRLDELHAEMLQRFSVQQA